ncbi:MAG TPA: hypothetical protein VJ961_00735 [Mariprofundaceae bacterium]|nr:hypothetical protein [Mariprofundaceae bacterium]
MRIVIMLLLALAVAILLALFPHVADQPLRLEAFGWIFESRQGPFIIALLLLLGLFWLLRRIVVAIMAGPGHAWQALRMGGRKRQESHLRDGLAQLIDMRGDLGARHFRKVRNIIPSWAVSLLRRSPAPAADQPLPGEDDDALQIALAARITTDPHANPKPDLSTRKMHLEAWLRTSPEAPLAMQRMLEIAEEEGDWERAARLLEELWNKGGRSAATIRPRLAEAYLALAKQKPESALDHLRKAHRLAPESTGVLLALGRAQGDEEACRKLWSAHLEQHDDAQIAEALYELLKRDALKAYRKMEKLKIGKMTPAQAWLRAQLAHDANLTGLAMDHMQELVKHHPGRLAWKALGDWHARESDWVQAAHCYQKALQVEEDSPEFDTGSDKV